MSPLLPFQYQLVFECMREPQSAYDLASAYWRQRQNATAQSVSGNLRPLVRRGWLTRSESGIYRATKRACEAVSW